VAVRQALASPGDVFLPTADGSFQTPALAEARVDPRTIPDPDAMRCLRLMEAGIGKRVGTTFLDWLDEPPLMPPVDETLDETELEQVAKKKLPHLEAACRSPRTHLKLDEERQLVGRCKRPSTRAPMVLAARSEDWDRKTLWGIRPKRVLGLVREDLYDLYENRLTVALVDRLDEALTQRVREVRRVVRQARSINDWQELLAAGKNHRRAHRMYQLWGELWSEEGLLARAERALRRLVQLRRRVLALKDSPLYRRIGGHRRAVHLRMTNLLTHDDVYRGVAELWQAWERHVLMGQEDPQTRWDNEQRAVRGMHLYAQLLVLRALHSLGFEPDDDHLETPWQPGAELHLWGPSGRLRLQWQATGATVLTPERGSAFNVSFILGMLEGAPAAGDWLASLEQQRTLVLHLEADRARVPEKVHVRLHGPGPVDHPIIHVPVAPWQLESVERVARSLRWRLWTDLITSYARTTAYPSRTWPTPGSPPSWVKVKDGAIAIVEPPIQARWPDLERRIVRRESELRRLEEQLAAIKPRDPRRNRDKLHIKKGIEAVRVDLERDQEVQGSLAAESEAIALLLTCPVCRGQATRHDFEHVDGRFRVSCPTCESTWGLRDCNACVQLIPFLSSPESPPGASDLDIDTAYGCDVLTFPIEDEVFRCLHCGHRSDGEPDAES